MDSTIAVFIMEDIDVVGVKDEAIDVKPEPAGQVEHDMIAKNEMQEPPAKVEAVAKDEEQEGEEAQGEVPTEAEIADKIELIMVESDLENITVKMVRNQLQEHFQTDLTSKKDFIKQTIHDIINRAVQAEAEAEQQNDSEVEDVKPAADAMEIDEQSEDEGDSDEEEKPVAPKKKKKTGFNKPLQLSEDLFQFLGGEETHMGRPAVVKALWDYIKAHKLQDPKDKRNIILDDSMAAVFKCKTMTMFSMNKKLSAHMKNAHELVDEPEAGSDEELSEEEEKPKPKPKKRKAPEKKKETPVKKSKVSQSSTRGVPPKKDEQKPAKKKVKEEKVPGEFTGPLMHLSPELAKVVGTDKMKRTEVVCKIWDYIKANNLQNPNDKREILCDDLLQDVMGVKKVTRFNMNKHVQKNFLEKVEVGGPATKKAKAKKAKIED